MIRLGNMKDSDFIMKLLIMFHSESEFRDILLDKNVLLAKINSYISHPDVLVMVNSTHDNNINGVLIAYVSPFFFSRCIGAWDIAFYFHPDDRGSAAPSRMIREYIRWAKERKAKRIFLGTAASADPSRVGRFYQSCGFESIGGIFRHIDVSD